MKEWLCLTCQMQRALEAAVSEQPPVMKPQASPSKVSSPASSQKDAPSNQIKDAIPTEKDGKIDKTLRDSITHGEAKKKEDIIQTAGVSGPTKEERPSLPPAGNAPTSSALQSKKTEPAVSNLVKSIPAEAPPVTTGGENLVLKKTPIQSEPSKGISEKKEEKVEEIEKSADLLVKPSSQVLDPSPKEVEQNELQKAQPEKTPHKPADHEVTPLKQNKTGIDPQEPAKPEASKDAPKVGGSTCPLCKVEINMDSKDPPNFNACTDCKNIVCNKCGFSPIPNVTKVFIYVYIKMYILSHSGHCKNKEIKKHTGLL